MTPTVFDFLPEFMDFDRWLAEELAWQLANGEFFNIDNMSDRELREAIVDDVLGVTIWEKQSGKRANFTFNILTRFLTHEQRVRVKEAMTHPEIYPFFDPNFNENIRIFDTIPVLQAAMEYAQVWFSGYDQPAGLISVDREKLQQMINDNGGIENVADGLLMEMVATHETSKTIN